VSGLPGLAAESRSGDANGQWARVLAANGTNVYALGGTDAILGQRFGITNFPLEGINPPKAQRPPSRYDVPCETQEPPDLRTIPGQPPQKVASGSFSSRQTALNQANQMEGLADALVREDRPAQARKWYEAARDLRAKHDLLGRQWDIRGGRLTIVEGAGERLTRGGAPLIAPYLRHGVDAKPLSRLERRMERLQGITGKVNAGEGGG
jgi:hypothetical protein